MGHDKPGRPTSLTPAVHAKIVDAISKGLPNCVAAQLAGINQASLYNWQIRAEKGESPYFELFEDLKAAEAAAQEACLEKIRTDESWQSKAWMLERRWPAAYGRKDAVFAKIDGEIKHLDLTAILLRAQTLEDSIQDGELDQIIKRVETNGKTTKQIADEHPRPKSGGNGNG